MHNGRRKEGRKENASVLMQRLSYPTETVLSNKITRDRIFLSFKDSPRKPLGRRPFTNGFTKTTYFCYNNYLLKKIMDIILIIITLYYSKPKGRSILKHSECCIEM